jgi:hypothetical protein
MRAGVASAGVDDASNSSAPMKSLYEQPEKPFEDVKGCMFTSKALRLPFTSCAGLSIYLCTEYLPRTRSPNVGIAPPASAIHRADRGSIGESDAHVAAATTSRDCLYQGRLSSPGKQDSQIRAERGVYVLSAVSEGMRILSFNQRQWSVPLSYPTLDARE